MASRVNSTALPPIVESIAQLNDSRADGAAPDLKNEDDSQEDVIASFIANYWPDLFNASLPATESSSAAVESDDWDHLPPNTSTVPTWPANFSTSPTPTASFPANESLLHTAQPSELTPTAMAPTQSLSTMATNFVSTLFSGNGHHRGVSSLTSPRPSSNPEVFIYDGPTSAESEENTVSSNVTSFFGNQPTLSSSTTAILSGEEDADLVPLGAMCYSSPEDYELITSMICSSLLVLGVFFLIYGYRCFRAVAFFTGLVFGTALVYAVCTAEHLVELPYGNLIVALAAGLLVGLLTMLVIYIGLFVIGLQLGLLLSAAMLSVIYLLRPFFVVLQPPLSALTLLILFVAVGLVGAFSTVYFSKGCTIIASSLYGSALTLLCADYFVENFKIVHWFLDNLSNGDDWYGLLFAIQRGQTLCLGSHIVLDLWPLLTLLGIIIQGCLTARGVQFGGEYGVVASTPATMILRSGAADITSTSPSSRGKSQEDVRLEQKHRKYRYLYQVRTAHGDVISQHYFQSMQNKSKLCLPDQDSYTFNSDLSSHFLPESRTTTLSVA